MVEDLRYVDTAVVLAFVKARADATGGASRDPNHFATHMGYVLCSDNTLLVPAMF